jgi:carbon storage regulator CsrA
MIRVVTRKQNEEIVIGDCIVVRIIEICGDKVRIGVQTPKDVSVFRKETYEALRQAKAMPDLQNQVVQTYPPNGNLQLMRLDTATDFDCSRCKTTKRAKLVAVVGGDWNKLLCNGCYGKLLSERTEQ